MVKDKPKIPWAEHTVVEYASPHYITLGSGSDRIDVDNDGRWNIEYDSRRDIEAGYLKLDEDLTDELEDVWDDLEGYGWEAKISNWITYKYKLKSRSKTIRKWAPTRWTGGLGRVTSSGNTYNEEYFAGSTFEYVIFDSDEYGPGIVIMWHRGGDVRSNYQSPEVWLGDPDSFMSSQFHPERDADSFVFYNEQFENGIVWAINQLGLFERNIHKLPTEVVQALSQRPDMLYPELIEKLGPKLDTGELPNELQHAVRVWLTRERRELERGQEYLWKDIYAEEK